MNPETCPEHEKMVIAIAELKKDMVHNTDLTREILKCVKGNGTIGLMTQAELNKSSIRRAWGWLSAVSVSLLGLAGYILKKAL